MIKKIQAIAQSEQVPIFLQNFEELMYLNLVPNRAECIRAQFHLLLIQHLRRTYQQGREELLGLLEVYQSEQYPGDKGTLLKEIKYLYRELCYAVKRLALLAPLIEVKLN